MINNNVVNCKVKHFYFKKTSIQIISLILVLKDIKSNIATMESTLTKIYLFNDAVEFEILDTSICLKINAKMQSQSLNHVLK